MSLAKSSAISISCKPGDEVIVYSGSAALSLHHQRTAALSRPRRWTSWRPTNEPTVTLISCYPYLVDNQRIVVFGQLSAVKPESVVKLAPLLAVR